jgi:hypothetical protein
MITTNSFVPMRFILKSGDSLPNYVFIIEIPMVPTFVSILGVIAIVYSSGLVGGGGSVNGNGVIRNGVAIKNGGIGPSIST